MGRSILNRSVGIEKKVDHFLDLVSESGLVFKTGFDYYLKGDMESFQQTMDTISEIEHKGDVSRRSIEEELYIRTLIPESRGDVLDLLENMDSLLDRVKGAVWRFEIERMEINPQFHEDFRVLIHNVLESVEAIVRSVRAFFKDISSVRDHIHKVSYWETEADKVSTRLQRHIFRH